MEVDDSLGRSFERSESQVNTSVCLKAGSLERMPQIVSNTRLRVHPATRGNVRLTACVSSEDQRSPDAQAGSGGHQSYHG